MSTYTNLLKQRFSEPGTLYGMWLSLGCADVAEAVAHAGFDWLCIDMEHSPNDSQDVVSQLRAVAAAPACVARPAWCVRGLMTFGATM